MTDIEMAAKIAEVDARSKSNVHRLDTLERKVDAVQELAQSVAVMAEAQKNLTTAMQGVQADVAALKSAPAKKWELFVEKVLIGTLCVALGAVASLLIGKIF